MKHTVNNVLIAGGTGFIGYHAAKLFLKQNINVTSIALPNEIDLFGWYPQDIHLLTGNLFEMTEAEITALVTNQNIDTFVYALGPDDRVIPSGNASDFFYHYLVTQTLKIVKAIHHANIHRVIVLNSYFSHFDKVYHGELSKRHPYIKARISQELSLIDYAKYNDIDIMMLELPFIFGVMPNRKPLWREHFLSQFEGMKKLYFPAGGGTAMISVEGVAEAIVACAYYGENSTCYPVGMYNMLYRQLIETMMSFIGDQRKYQGVLPIFAAIGASKRDKAFKKAGKESGLNTKYLMLNILNRKFFIDPDFMMERLHFEELGFNGGKDIYLSISETMAECYPEIFEKRKATR